MWPLLPRISNSTWTESRQIFILKVSSHLRSAITKNAGDSGSACTGLMAYGINQGINNILVKDLKLSAHYFVQLFYNLKCPVKLKTSPF